MTNLVYNNIFESFTNKAEAADLEFRADLMLAMRDLFKSRKWNQAKIGKVLGIPQPRVSELMTGKIDKCSSDKLIGYLAKLDLRLKPTFVEPKRNKPTIECDVLVLAHVA